MPEVKKVAQHRANDLKEIIAQFENVFPTSIKEGVLSYLEAKGYKTLVSETPLMTIYIGNVKVTNYDVTLINDTKEKEGA